MPIPVALFVSRINRLCSGEEKPSCLNCHRQGEVCDYSVRLNWDGRSKRGPSDGSPTSSGDFSSHVLSFPLSSLDSVTSVQPPDSSCVPAENNSPDQAPVTPASHPSGLNGFHDSPPTTGDQPLDHFGIIARKSPPMSPPQIHGITSTWPEQSAPLTTTVQETMSLCPSSHPGSLDGVPYPSPEGTNSSIGSLSTFNFTPTSVSQPTSFLRQSVNISHADAEHDTWPDRLPKRARLDPPSSTDPFGFYGRNGPEVSVPGECSGTQALDPGVSPLPGTGRDILKPSPSGSTPAGEFIAKLIDGRLVSSTSPGDSSANAIDGPHIQPEGTSDPAASVSHSERKWKAYLNSVEDNYGLDCGRPDLDLNKNDDHSAIDINTALDSMNSGRRVGYSEAANGNELADQRGSVKGRYAYYESPVPINIPRHLSPLPSSLLDNPINLMYFHHFLNHTSRMLVPHDCENNPFILVLPSSELSCANYKSFLLTRTVAVSDPNLLNLVLAYSASHRARHLEHPEPANRIAHLVSNVFPTLRLALDGPHENVTDSHLATAMILLSLKIISPSTFEVPITWQSHLKLARDLFLARWEQLSRPGNRIGAFFARWLGYLDIFGSLSCRHNEPPLLGYNSVLGTCCAEEYDESSVDCFTGFSPRTGALLTRLGRLVHQCDNERFDEMGTFLVDWRPSADMVLEAETLMRELEQSNTLAHAKGKHFQDSGPLDMVAIDKVFGYAGMLQLHRRVLCTPPSSPPVQEPLDKLNSVLKQIRHGAPAEVGVLFPLFTAGCETRDPQQRVDIMERFNILEKTGMKQVS